MAAKKLTKSFPKHHDSVLDFSINREDWLQGDIILSSTWNVPFPLTDSGNFFTPEGVSTVWVGGGIVGTKHTITNTVVTSGGATDVRCIDLIITDC